MAAQLEGLTLRRLDTQDAQAMLALEKEMLAALPDESWYYPSDLDDFIKVGQEGSGYGYFDNGKLVALAVCSQGEPRGELSYARKIGHDPIGTWDFRDVMIEPKYRRRGLHTAFLQLYEDMARRDGAKAFYATIDPSNLPSIASFQKAGYTLQKTQPAYDGRLRGYYRKTL